MQTGVFSLLSMRAAWLGQRHAVLARNIANADTPRFQPLDIVPFPERLRAAAGAAPTALAATHARHAQPDPRPATARERPTGSFETAPAGNAVVLEEEVTKLGATRLDHELASALYGKYLTLTRHALGVAA